MYRKSTRSASISVDYIGHNLFNFRNGDIYIGSYAFKLPYNIFNYGYGQYYCKDSTALKGIWKDGKLLNGNVTYPDGSSYTGPLDDQSNYLGKGRYTIPGLGELNSFFVKSFPTGNITLADLNGYSWSGSSTPKCAKLRPASPFLRRPRKYDDSAAPMEITSQSTVHDDSVPNKDLSIHSGQSKNSLKKPSSITTPDYNSSGLFNFENGDLYIGGYGFKVPDSVFSHGFGIYWSKDRTKLNGEWDDGKLVYGKISYPDGSTYIGNIDDQKYHGKGIYKMPGVGSIVGNFVRNNPVGQILLSDINGYIWYGDPTQTSIVLRPYSQFLSVKLSPIRTSFVARDRLTTSSKARAKKQPGSNKTS